MSTTELATSLPRPRGLGIVHGLQLARDPLGFLRRAREHCGDTFGLQMPGDPLRVVTGDPEHVKSIFALPPDSYRMSNQAIPLNLGTGSLLFLDGPRHQRLHRLLMPPLHGDHLRSYAELIVRATDDAIARWTTGDAFALLPSMKWITLTVICECVLGAQEGDRVEVLRDRIGQWMAGPMSTLAFSLSMMVGAERVRAFYDRQMHRSPIMRGRRPGRWRLPWQRAGDAKADLVGMLREDFEACRRAADPSRLDVLALLSTARDETGALLETDDAVDQLLTMLVGGYESAANTLAWTVHHLLLDPEAMVRLRTEIDESQDPGGRRPWADACIQEALRLHPIAPVVNRELTCPLRLGDYDIPAGSILWPSIYLAQTHAPTWSDPFRYDPARLLDRRPRAHEWLPFGGGRRRCIGAAFAEMEMRLVLSRLIERVDLRPASATRSHAILRGVTVSPDDGVRVVAHEIRPRTRS